jgi:hypothetical protein
MDNAGNRIFEAVVAGCIETRWGFDFRTCEGLRKRKHSKDVRFANVSLVNAFALFAHRIS